MSAEARFREAMANDGIAIDQVPIPDGEIHRFHIEGDKAGSVNGWYVFYGRGGAFGCWKRGFTQKWSDGYGELSPADRQEADARMREAIAKAQLKREQLRESARGEAGRIWEASDDVSDNAYLKAKNVNAHGLKSYKGTLCIPLRDSNDTIHSRLRVNFRASSPVWIGLWTFCESGITCVMVWRFLYSKTFSVHVSKTVRVQSIN